MGIQYLLAARTVRREGGRRRREGGREGRGGGREGGREGGGGGRGDEPLGIAGNLWFVLAV